MKINIHKDNERFIRMIKVAVIFLGAAFYSYYGIYKMLFVHFELVGNDFLKGYFAANNFVQGQSIYYTPLGMNPFYYLPLTTLIFLPFCILSLHQAITLWFIMVHAIIFFSLYIIIRYCYHIHNLNSALAGIVALCFSMPLYQTVISGNINILIFLGLCLIYSCLLSGKGNLAAAILACCSFLKIYPALLMITFVRNRDYRAFKIFASFAVLLGALSGVIFGLSNHLVFIDTLPFLASFVGPLQCMSFTFVLKLFLPIRYSAFTFIANLVFLTLLLISWWKTAQDRVGAKSPNSGQMVDLFVLTVIIVLVVPSTWLLYHALFIPIFYFILFAQLQDRDCLSLFNLFILLFSLINFWEIIAYHLPLSFDGLTIYQVSENRASFPILYPILASVPFILNIIFFVWLLINYDNLRLFIATLISPKPYQIKPNKCSK